MCLMTGKPAVGELLAAKFVLPGVLKKLERSREAISPALQKLSTEPASSVLSRDLSQGLLKVPQSLRLSPFFSRRRRHPHAPVRAKLFAWARLGRSFQTHNLRLAGAWPGHPGGTHSFTAASEG